MNYTMARVQVYLNPQDVGVLDVLAKHINIKRSQILRDITNTVSTRYEQVAQLLAARKPKTNPLMELAGIEKSKTGTVSLNVDEIYNET